MGKLIGLELHNFKSYRGTTSIGFGTSCFTSIIGPNGSGKSNMMDAISFVLGVRSSHLRSSQLSDLIYRGKIMMDKDDRSDIESDEDEGDQSGANPSRAYVMCIYERSNGDILKLKRTVTKNGNSEYRVNNQIYSALDYSNLLKRENILIKARNFLVFQGDVEQIASQSPSDLTRLIETISGSIEYKKEFDYLKEEQESANEQTKSIFSTRRTLNGELRQYKEQCMEAEAFEKKLVEKSNLIKLSNMYSLYHIEREIASLNKNLHSYHKEVKSLKSQLQSEESAHKAISSEHAKFEIGLNKFNRKISSKSKDLDERQRELIPLNTEKSLVANKLTDYQARIKELEIEIERQNSNIVDITTQLEIVKQAKEIFETKLQQETSIQLTPEALREYQSLRESYMRKGGAEQESILSSLIHERELIEDQLSNAETTKAATKDIVKSLDFDVAELQRKLADLTRTLNDSLDSLKAKKDGLSQMRQAERNYLDEEFKLNSKLKEVLIQINDLTANQRESNRERKLRETVATLKRLFPGVKGLVSDLCRPRQKKYETAVATILGKNFDSIVVENLSVASKCIEYLKEQRAGVATFIPLDSVASKAPASYLRQAHESAQPSLDCVEYEPYLEKAIQYCCGNSMICENMEVAKYIRWERKIEVKVVTLEGSLIHKAGLMTGGTTKNDGRKFNKNELNSLQDLKIELVRKIDDLKKRLPNKAAEIKLNDEIKALEEELNQIRRNRVLLQRELDDKESHAKIQRENLEATNQKLAELEQSLNAKEEQVKNQDVQRAVIQDEVYSEFCARNGLTNINEYENLFKNSAKYKQRTQFLKQISVLENKASFERERLEDSKTRLEKLSQVEARLKGKLATLSNDIDTRMQAIDVIESELELLKEEFSQFESENDSNSKQNSHSHSALEDLKHEIANKRAKMDETNEELLQLLNKKLQILKTCKVENIMIPITGNHSLDDVPIDIVAEDDEEEDKLLKFAKSVEVDFEGLPPKYREKSDNTLKELQEEQDALQQELESLTPNAKAVERLREVESKLSRIEREFKQRRQDEQDVVNKFNELKQKRYAKFSEAFEHISQNINGIYKELTKAPVSPMGGSAYLTLEDEDEPFNAGIKYHAMPPMKRFRDMELLSGGEKTIAALALLFAIHSYHPSPFFVLDEVDAALDNSNVNKLADYIKNNCNENFQFIVISLKNSLFEKSDSLIGIFRNQDENSSKTVTLDLRTYPERA